MAVKVKLNIAGFRQLRNEVVGDLADRAGRIAEACGDGYVAESETGRNRARAAVIAATPEAQLDNARRNTLINNLGAGR